MKKNKTALVLEGGGMRGAYTAGALSWLVDNNIEFDSAYGISTGAVHMCNFLLKNTQNLHDFSIYHISNVEAIGLRPFLKTGRLVNYDFLFKTLMVGKLKFSLDPIRHIKTIGKVGLYECERGGTYYKEIKDLSMEELQAACTLPLIGRTTAISKDRHIMDGGITEMIPIKQSIQDGNTKHLVITTKPADYVRKPSKAIVVNSMYINYPKWKCIGDDYKVRDKNYYEQIALIQELQKQDNAIYVCPSKHSNVSRLGGSIEELEELYQLGRSDMENKKEEIFRLFK